jgi:hypothetical protein
MQVSESPNSVRPRPPAGRLMPRAIRCRWANTVTPTQRFAARLLISYAMALALVGVIGYLTIDHDLRRAQVDTYAAEQAADARSFQAITARAGGPAIAILRLDAVMDVLFRQPGTLEMNLIDQRHIVVASGQPGWVGRKAIDPRIRDALQLGRGYAGQERGRAGTAPTSSSCGRC